MRERKHVKHVNRITGAEYVFETGVMTIVRDNSSMSPRENLQVRSTIYLNAFR